MQRIMATFVIGWTDRSAGGTRTLRCLVPGHRGTAGERRSLYTLESLSDDTPAFSSVLKGSLPVAEMVTVHGAEDAELVLININTVVNATKATALAIELVDLMETLDVREVFLIASVPIRPQSGGPLKRPSNRRSDQEDVYVSGGLEAKVEGAGALPGSSQIVDDVACALLLALDLKGVPTALIACHGHSIRCPDPREDKTLSAIRALGRAVESVTNGCVRYSEDLLSQIDVPQGSALNLNKPNRSFLTYL